MRTWKWNMVVAAGLLSLCVSAVQARVAVGTGPPFHCLTLGGLTVDLNATEPGGWWSPALGEGKKRCIPTPGLREPFSAMEVTFSIADNGGHNGLFIVKTDNVITSLVELKAQLRNNGWRETGASMEASRRLAGFEMACFERENEWMDVIASPRGGAMESFIIATGGTSDEP